MKNQMKHAWPFVFAAIVVVLIAYAISCAGVKVEVQIPEIFKDEVLDEFVTITTANATPSEHKTQDSPFPVQEGFSFDFQIKKADGIQFTVDFRGQEIPHDPDAPDDGPFVYSIDLTQTASGTYAILITASRKTPSRTTIRNAQQARIWIQVFNSPPDAPVYIQPRNGATSQPIHNLDFSWEAAADPDPGDEVFYLFYLGRSQEALELQATPTNTSYTHPGPLEYDTQYFWQVVAEDGKKVHQREKTPGDVWSFTTKNVPPNIEFDPSHLPEEEMYELEQLLRFRSTQLLNIVRSTVNEEETVTAYDPDPIEETEDGHFLYEVSVDLDVGANRITVEGENENGVSNSLEDTTDVLLAMDFRPDVDVTVGECIQDQCDVTVHFVTNGELDQSQVFLVPHEGEEPVLIESTLEQQPIGETRYLLVTLTFTIQDGEQQEIEIHLHSHRASNSPQTLHFQVDCNCSVPPVPPIIFAPATVVECVFDSCMVEIHFTSSQSLNFVRVQFDGEETLYELTEIEELPGLGFRYYFSMLVPVGSHTITFWGVNENGSSNEGEVQVDCNCTVPGPEYQLLTSIPVGGGYERPVSICRSSEPPFIVDIMTADTEDPDQVIRKVYKAGYSDGDWLALHKKSEENQDQHLSGIPVYGIAPGLDSCNIMQWYSAFWHYDYYDGLVKPSGAWIGSPEGYNYTDGAVYSSRESGRVYIAALLLNPVSQRSGNILETYSLFHIGEEDKKRTQRTIPSGILAITGIDTLSNPETADNPFKDLVIAVNSETRQIVSFTPVGEDDPIAHFTIDPEHGAITSIDVLTATADETKVLVTTVTVTGIAQTHIIDIQSGSYITGFVTHELLAMSMRDDKVFYAAVSDEEGRIYVIHSYHHGVQIWVPSSDPDMVSCCL